MKQSYFLLLIILGAILMGSTANAQSILQCPSDYNYRLPIANDPQQQLRIDRELKQIRENMQMNQSRNVPDTLKIIPIVVHVLHDNGKGALTKAQIIAGIDAMNIDLRKKNSDTTNVRSYYKPLLSDLKVEMRFAQIDPNGNCTDGIEYINTVMTYNVSDTCKSVADWASDKYFNFWIVNSIDPSPWGLSGTIAGYEAFPWFGIGKKYGAVVRSDSWAGSNRTLTHEIGHCLGLWHMWQDQSKNNWGDGCTLDSLRGKDCTDHDDMVCDTPPMYLPNSGCDYKANSCNADSIGPSPYPTDTLDMVENFMSYSSCKYLFTVGQKDRVISVFGTYPELQNLVSYANLVASGTNNGYVTQLCKPKAAFTGRTMVCKNGSIGFTDASKGGTATSWKWDFTGGTPASSTSQNPIIQYNSTGKYDVRLISTNASGSDTILMTNYVTVNNTTVQYSSASYTESFEDSTVVYNDWTIVSSNGKAKWKRIKGTGYTGNSCIMIDNISEAWSGETIEIISPSYNLSSVTTPECAFKIAYSQLNANISELLKVYVSTDCGSGWVLRLSRGNALMKSVADQATPFTPASQSEWKEDKLSLASYAANPNVRFKFQFVSGKGNNIYIDDINIRQATGINENELLIDDVNLYPNPTNKEAFLDFTIQESIDNVHIAMYNVLGKVVNEIANTEKLSAGTHNYKIALSNDLAPGMYFVKMTSGSLQWTKKLVVE